MPRPKVPSDVIEFAKSLKAEGIPKGSVKYPDGLEVSWGEGNSDDEAVTPLKKWQAGCNATS